MRFLLLYAGTTTRSCMGVNPPTPPVSCANERSYGTFGASFAGLCSTFCFLCLVCIYLASIYLAIFVEGHGYALISFLLTERNQGVRKGKLGFLVIWRASGPTMDRRQPPGVSKRRIIRTSEDIKLGINIPLHARFPFVPSFLSRPHPQILFHSFLSAGCV